MSFLLRSFFFILISQQLFAGAAPEILFSINGSQVTVVKMTEDFEIKKDKEDKILRGPLWFEKELIQYRLLPDFLEFFEGQNVLGSELKIEVREDIQQNYCAFVPKNQSVPTIWFQRKCLTGRELPIIFFHELQHIVENINGAQKVDWLNEGLSELLAYRLTKQSPTLLWQKQMNEGVTQGFFFNHEHIGHLHSQNRQELYATAHLFLSYLYEHFGKDLFLRNLILAKHSGAEAIEAVLTSLNQQEYKLDPQLLNLNSLFFNFAVALNLNTNWGTQNAMFALNGYGADPVLTELKLQGQFEVLEEEGTLSRSLVPYQTWTLRLATHSQCLKWQSTGRVKVVIIDQTNSQQKIRFVEANTCFSLQGLETLSVTSFEEQSVFSLSAQ